MRNAALLLPAAWLALSAAALPAPTLQAVFECQAEVAPSLKLLETLTVTRKDDTSQPPMLNIKRAYAAPAGLTVFGFKPYWLASYHIIEAEGEKVMVLSGVDAPYGEIEAAILKARGLTACPERGAGDKAECLIRYRYRSEPDALILSIRDEGKFISVTCGHGFKE